MTTLRKKILYLKIQNILTKNDFVLFFQFNNVKSKNWVILKNQILTLRHINMLVIRNKITCEMVNTRSFLFELNSKKKYDSQENYLKNEFINVMSHFEKTQKQLCFLCQGPTLVLGFNSIQQCKMIYDILKIFAYNLPSNECFNKLQSKKKPFVTGFNNYKNETNYLPKNLVHKLETRKLPFIFTKKKLVLQPQKYTVLNENTENFNLFFMGGLVQGKIINHLDLEKLSNLDNSVYVNLIQQWYSSVTWFLFLKIIMELKLLKCFENNLLNLLVVYKNKLKKQK